MSLFPEQIRAACPHCDDSQRVGELYWQGTGLGYYIIQFLKVMYTVLIEQYLMFYQGYFVRQIQFLSGPLGLRFITFINWIMSVP